MKATELITIAVPTVLNSSRTASTSKPSSCKGNTAHLLPAAPRHTQSSTCRGLQVPTHPDSGQSNKIWLVQLTNTAMDYVNLYGKNSRLHFMGCMGCQKPVHSGKVSVNKLLLLTDIAVDYVALYGKHSRLRNLPVICRRRHSLICGHRTAAVAQMRSAWSGRARQFRRLWQ